MTDVNKLKKFYWIGRNKKCSVFKISSKCCYNIMEEEIWTEDMIARDSIQNFYDGVVENNIEIDKIDISIVKIIKIYVII